MGAVAEKPEIDPVQERDLEALVDDFQPEPEAVPGAVVPDQAAIDSGQMCATCLSVGFGLVASRRGNHWALSDEEAEQFGGALGAVLDKYCPDIEGGPEYALIVAAGMVIAPRFLIDKRLEAANDEAANDPGVIDGDPTTAKFAE